MNGWLLVMLVVNAVILGAILNGDSFSGVSLVITIFLVIWLTLTLFTLVASCPS